MLDPILKSYICRKEFLGNYLNSHLLTPEILWLCNLVLGIQGIHPSTHNQEKPRKSCTSDLRTHNHTSHGRSSVVSPPVLGISHDTICHHEKYGSVSMSAPLVFRNCYDTHHDENTLELNSSGHHPKCQEAPRQNPRHNDIGTIPQYPRDPKK